MFRRNSWAALQIAITIAVSLNMSGETYRFTSWPHHVAYRQMENVQKYDPASFFSHRRAHMGRRRHQDGGTYEFASV